MKTNKITIKQMFDGLTPTAIQVYGGKKVLFIVPSETLDINDDSIEVIEDDSITYEDQRNFVSDHVITSSSDKIIVLTQSPVVLSDAFACQIYTYRNGDNGIRFRYVGSLATFGASPCRIALHVFNVAESIGSLSDQILDQWLNTDWTIERLPELKEICNEIGGGWPRARLDEICDQLEGKKG